jgi:hypothetical protein
LNKAKHSRKRKKEEEEQEEQEEEERLNEEKDVEGKLYRFLVGNSSIFSKKGENRRRDGCTYTR